MFTLNDINFNMRTYITFKQKIKCWRNVSHKMQCTTKNYFNEANWRKEKSNTLTLNGMLNFWYYVTHDIHLTFNLNFDANDFLHFLFLYKYVQFNLFIVTFMVIKWQINFLSIFLLLKHCNCLHVEWRSSIFDLSIINFNHVIEIHIISSLR